MAQRKKEAGDDSEASSKSGRMSVSRGVATVRARLAQLVWLVCVVCALLLATGALLVALSANKDNSLVTFVLDAADAVDLGVFSRDAGVFEWDRPDPDRAVKNALANWGLGAVAWLVVGRLLDRLIRP